MISEEYAEQNRRLHAQEKYYGSFGGKWAPAVLQLCSTHETMDVLEYGCGKATLNLQLPFSIHSYDPAIRKYSDSPSRADIVVCTDVMEHVEPEYTLDVLDALRDLTAKVLLVNIATRAAEKTLPDGRNAHLVVEKASWWLERLEQRFIVLKHEATEEDLTAICAPLVQDENV